MSARAVLVAILIAAAAALWVPSACAQVTPGVGLGLFASDPSWDYGELVTEIAELGATDVLVVVPWYQWDIHATAIRPRYGHSPTLPTVLRTLLQVQAAGMQASLMPIVLIEHTEHPKQWRGVIDPQARGGPAVERWFRSYTDFLLSHAVLAEQAGAVRLVVGSELLSMEGERALWLDLIARARRAFSGRLLYSANWDHFRKVTFWDALDEIGVNGYFRLAKDGVRPELDEVIDAWDDHLKALDGLGREVGLPVLLTEIGYPSKVTAAAKAWCVCPHEALDLELQATLLDGFLQVVDRGGLPFDGFFLWNWFGLGGPDDGGFTPRGKPAEDVVRSWLRR
jgi:hypothetical protein